VIPCTTTRDFYQSSMLISILVSRGAGASPQSVLPMRPSCEGNRLPYDSIHACHPTGAYLFRIARPLLHCAVSGPTIGTFP